MTISACFINGVPPPEMAAGLLLPKVRLKVNPMQCRTKLLAPVLLALLTPLALSAIETPAPARLVALTGTLTVKRAQLPVQSLKLSDAVQFGDELITDQRSSATLRLPDGSTVRIHPDSRVVLREESGEWKDFLHVFFGSVKVKIEKITGRPNPKTVTTPTAIVAVRGTVFNVIVDANEDTKVEVEEGLVSVSNPYTADEEVRLAAGECCWVRRGQRPSPPERMGGSVRRGVRALGERMGMGLPGSDRGTPGLGGAPGSTMGGGMHGTGMPSGSSGGTMHPSSGKMGKKR